MLGGAWAYLHKPRSSQHGDAGRWCVVVPIRRVGALPAGLPTPTHPTAAACRLHVCSGQHYFLCSSQHYFLNHENTEKNWAFGKTFPILKPHPETGHIVTKNCVCIILGLGRGSDLALTDLLQFCSWACLFRYLNALDILKLPYPKDLQVLNSTPNIAHTSRAMRVGKGSLIEPIWA